MAVKWSYRDVGARFYPYDCAVQFSQPVRATIHWGDTTGGALAEVLSCTTGVDGIVSAAMVFNQYAFWHFGAAESANTSLWDLRGITTHEWGHMAGQRRGPLEAVAGRGGHFPTHHSPCPGSANAATMCDVTYAEPTRSGGTYMRTLDRHDRHTIRQAYRTANHPASPTLYLRNTNGSGPAENTFAWNQDREGSHPLMCDWNGDGTATPGVRHGTTWYITDSFGATASLATTPWSWGNLEDEAICGDWNGDGSETPGLRRGSTFFLSNDFTGTTHSSFNIGYEGLAVAGDWDGPNIGPTISGQFRPEAHGVAVKSGWSNTWYYRSPPFVGDGYTDLFDFGDPPDLPIAGDWNGDGTWGPGVMRGSTFHLRQTATTGAADNTFTSSFAIPGDWPLVGNFNGTVDDTETVAVRRGG